MTRLPPALMPLWPAAKRAHRMATRASGRVHRAAPPSDRAVPQAATSTSVATAEREPEAVTVHGGGPRQRLHRDHPIGSPSHLRFWDDVADLDVVAPSVLEVTDGRLVGAFAATVTPGGVLDRETSPYFGTADWREHPVFLRRRLPPTRELSGTVLSLASPASGVNYYHSLMDTLPRWWLARDLLDDLEPDHVVIAHSSRWDRQLVQMTGLDRFDLVEPDPDVTVRADRLLVPCLANRSTLAPPWITRALREHLPAGHDRGLPNRIYVTRGSQRNTRRLVREAELLRLLEPLGFTVVDPGALTVQEQIDHFAAAEVVVGPHGAGLVNLSFAPEGVRVLELFAPRYLNPGYWAITDNIAGSVYRYLVAEPTQTDRPERRMNRVQDDIDLDPRTILDAVEALLEA